MDKIVISGGNKLKGKVSISGAKNAALAILPAVILSDGICEIENLPDISDISLMCKILEDIGAKVKFLKPGTMRVDPRNIRPCVASYDRMRNMRASCYLLGALLGKYKKAVMYFPGGCSIGVRPIDLHLKGFEALGAKVTNKGNK